MEAQTVFAILVGAALACFSLFMVGYSFFRGNETREIPPVASAPPESPFPPEKGGADEVGVDAILDSINTLDLEYQLGNVTDDQYREQMTSYRMQVAVAVKAQLQRGDASPELLLEQEILEARSRGTDRWQSCPRCDAPLPVPPPFSEEEGLSGDGDAPLAFCPHCNASLGNADSSSSPESPSSSEKGGEAAIVPIHTTEK